MLPQKALNEIQKTQTRAEYYEQSTNNYWSIKGIKPHDRNVHAEKHLYEIIAMEVKQVRISKILITAVE